MKKWSVFLLVVLISLNKISYGQSNCDLSGYTTFTMGGWGSPGNSTPGGIRDAHFNQVFPSGMTIGGNYTATFTSAAAIKDFLPAGSTASVFTQNYTNPTSTSAGVLGGQLAALTLNVKYNDAGYLGSNPVKLGQLIIVSGPLAGKSVYELLDYANIAIGGGNTSYNISDLNTAADKINNNFDNGTQDLGFLTCPPKVLYGSIGDFIWNDVNKNGIQDAGETGVSGVTVKLLDKNNLVISTTTTVNGNYSFTHLVSDYYTVQFFLPSGYTFSPKNAGTDTLLDSDADIFTGKTPLFALAPGQNNLTKDAGIFLTPLKGSIGDFVWNDENHDGIQDVNESGVPNVNVYLFNCDDSQVGMTTTDAQGKYLFSNLIGGSYYVKFDAPQGYAFTVSLQGNDAAKNSDANVVTGKTSCFTLADGENNLTIDAGIYVPTSSNTPDLVLEKTDNLVYMKPVGENNTYNITYKNTGSGDLLDGYITDELPAGLQYVSCSGALTCGDENGIIKFSLGTVPAGQSGVVSVTVSVVSKESNYCNTAYFGGKDVNGKDYKTEATDCDIEDSTSGGNNGGVESKGDLAELLFLRQLKIRYGMTTPMLSLNRAPLGTTASRTLKDVVPQSGPFSSTALEVTPFDILGISNALSAYAVDYKVSGNKTIGVVFSTITAAPYIYDHSKSVCDRLAGSEIKELKLIDINGHQFYATKLFNSNTNSTDYAVSFSVYESASGFMVENKWTYGEYTAPQNASFIYNFQVWSASYPSTEEIVKNILRKFSLSGTLIYMNNNQVVPELYIRKVNYKHTGKADITVQNNTLESKDITFNISYRTTQGADQLTFAKNYNVKPGETTLEVNIGIVSDAGIKLTQASGFKDETYLSGGTYADIVGPQSTISEFITNSYPQQVTGNYPVGSVVLAGGAKISGRINDWVSVMRSLTPNGTPYDLTGYNKLRFEANGTGVLSVLLDLTTTKDYNYHAYNITLTGNTNVYEIDLNSFSELWGGHTTIDPSKIRMLAFQFSKTNNANISNFNFEVKNIAFIPSNASTENGNTEEPKEFSLTQNYPNPFNPSTTIEFSVAKKEMLNLSIYNILGQKVMTLINREMESGVHRVAFDGSNLASGVYIYRLTGNSINVSKKMMLTK